MDVGGTKHVSFLSTLFPGQFYGILAFQQSQGFCLILFWGYTCQYLGFTPNSMFIDHSYQCSGNIFGTRDRTRLATFQASALSTALSFFLSKKSCICWNIDINLMAPKIIFTIRLNLMEATYVDVLF